MLLPNQLTVLRIILTPVFFFLFMAESPLLKQISLGVFLLAAFTDWYDGWLARKFNYFTEWGKIMDPLADKILTTSAFIAFVKLGVFELWMVVLIVLRDVIITSLRFYSESKKVSFATRKSAKIKTFMQMFFLYYCLIIFTLQTVEYIYNGNEILFGYLTNPGLIYYSMLVLTLYTVWTGIEYFYHNINVLKRLFNFETKQN